MSLLQNSENWQGRIYSNGWKPGRGGTGAAIEPATGDTLAEFGMADAADVAEATARAAEAQREWATVLPTERAAIIRRAARLLEDNREEFQEWLIREGGAVPGKAEFEVDLVLNEFWEASALPTHPLGHLLPTSELGRESVGRRIPLGVVGVISPWNFPMVLSLRAVAPALALGNAVVLKPDRQTAIVGGLLIARLFEEAGIPPGVLQVLPGAGSEAGAALLSDPNVAMIAFTGSTEIGRQIGAEAGRTLKRVSLELGGNNAFIVLDDADLEAASSAGAWGSFLHQGQVCMTSGRHIVLESVADEYIERLAARASNLPVGNPFTEQVAVGPLINEGQASNIERIVRETVDAGARVRAGGERNGRYFTPTVLSGVTRSMAAFREEIFGPVAPVTVVRDEAEALEAANDTEYGLVAAVQSGSPDRAAAFAAGLNTGMIHINDQTLNNDAFAPLGGLGASGNGSRYGTQSSLDEFTTWQWTTSRREAHPFPF